MKIIVGLGNPGEKFKDTRHNVGFMVVEKIAEIKQLSNWKLRKKLKAKILKQVQNDKEVLLVKPQTYMNSSGETIKKIPQYLNILISQFLDNLYLVHDELDLPLGEYKIQFGRGAAGHKGVASVIKELGTKDFWRVRVGIKPSSKFKVQSSKLDEEFVLGKFSKEEKEILDKVIEKAVKDLISRFSSLE